MSNSFLDLKNNKKESLETLTNEVSKLIQPKYEEDDRFWYPEVDKAGNGYAVIRFLPSPKGETLPFVRFWHHSFKGPTGSWYIENSLTTPRPTHPKGQPDPVSEYNTLLWNTGKEADKKTASVQKRKLTFVSNILVIKDPANPENEGKVFLYRYGKKIFDKLNMLMTPQFPDEAPINPFDFWEGVSLKLKICTIGTFRNYDQSEFVKPPSPLSDDESVLEKIWDKEYSLQEFLDEKKYKPYDELKSRLDSVLGTTGKRVEIGQKTSSDKESDYPFVDDDESETDENFINKKKLFQKLVDDND